jgi:hypothetical protein
VTGKVVLACMVLAVVGFFGWRYEQTRGLEHRLGRIASALAGRPVKVHCQGNTGAIFDVSGELGSVQFDAAGHPAATTDLKQDVCRWLSHLPGGGVADAATAVEVLTHESEHLAGYRDESVAQCRALQLMGWTAQQLGATPQQARVWTAYSVARTPSLAPEYYDPSCPAFRGQTTIPPAQ